MYKELKKSIREDYKKGTFRSMETKRLAKVRKSCPHCIEKITKYNGVRFGIDHDNLKQTKQNRVNGLAPSENQGLKWGEYTEFPLFIRHKDKEYIRAYAQKDKIETSWLMDGQPVTKETVLPFLLSSETADRKDVGNMLTLTLKLETVCEIC